MLSRICVLGLLSFETLRYMRSHDNGCVMYLESTLINIPYSLLNADTIVLTGWLAGRFRQLNCLLVVAVVLP
ncbi:hypothetical protein VTK73DRAFT_3531 [Phialemonium thermophilum]|uniref:Uncharacterized protein n=1 Tax=Phialemonium thermophilum TaxID=223376 RepID=A0ABR3XZS2_9PEZI